MTNNENIMNNVKRRWYDEDPTVSLAVSLLEKIDKSKQLECAKFIKEQSHSFNIYIEANKLEESFLYLHKRWYDEDKEISDAFEYLKLMPFDLRKETALEIINKIRETDS